MTLTELKTMLDATGYPVAYSHFNKPVTPPFICYRVPSSENLMADGRVYHKINNVDIELYTDCKDLEAESALESALDGTGLPYEVVETWIDAEDLFQRTYETRLI